MAKYCSKECELYGAVCDFCKYYHYNGEDVIREGTVYKNVYTGKGYCNYHKVKKDPGEGCNEFICEFIEEKK